jgi:hypothetical protein
VRAGQGLRGHGRRAVLVHRIVADGIDRRIGRAGIEGVRREHFSRLRHGRGQIISARDAETAIAILAHLTVHAAAAARFRLGAEIRTASECNEGQWE